VAVGQVVCLIDTSAAKPSGDAPAKSEDTPKEEKKAETPKATEPAPATYATGTASPAAKKILDEKNIDPAQIKGTGKDGRITKEDAVQAQASMGTPTGGNRGSERTKLSMLRRKVAERLV